MKKSHLIWLAVCLSMALVLAGCGKEAAVGSGSPSASQDENEIPTLVVANWKGYGSDEDYAAPVFEEMYNCKVVHQYFNSLEEMMTMLRTGGVGEIDVIMPSTVYVQAARDAGFLEPIDTDKITAYDDLIPAYRDLPEAVGEDGTVYAVPWTWGVTSLGYNPDRVDEEILHWSSLWDEKYKGKVAFFDDYNTAIMTAAIYLGEDPRNPDLDKVKEALIELKENTRTYWASYDDYLNPYKSGEIVIGNMWAGTATQLANEGEAVKFISPEEGTVGYVDMWCIVKDTKNYDLACKWLDFMVGEQFQTEFATVKGNAHNTVNQVVEDKLTDEQKAVLWIYPEPPKKIYMQPTQTPEEQAAWLEVWNEVKAQ